MALSYKLTKDEYAGLDEGIRGFYKEDGDGYVLDATGIDDANALKGALKKERDERSELEKLLKPWQTIGKKPEEISAILKKADEEEQKRLKESGKYDEMLKQVNAKHEEQLAALNKQIEQYRVEKEMSLIDQAATSAIAEEKGSIKLLLPLIKLHTKLVNVNGKDVVEIFDANGTPRVDAKGDYLTIADWVKEMKKDPDLQSAFAPSGNKGSGAPGSGNSGGSGNNNPWKKETFNLTEQARIYREEPERAIALAQAAGFKLSRKE